MLPFEFNGVVRLTRVGTAHLIFTMAIGFAAINTGNNSLYIALSFMLGTLLLSGNASKGGLKHIDLAIAALDEIWAGRPCHGTISVTNRSRIWNVRDLVITAPEMAKPILIPLLPHGATIEVDGTFLFQRRGRVRLTKGDLYTRYPFGFFLKKRRVPLLGESIVFPRLLDQTQDLAFLPEQAGEADQAGRPGSGHEIYSFREYVRGDSMRHVHWKRSANRGRWIMKQHETDRGQRIDITVDTFIPPGRSADDLEQIINEAATVAHQAMTQNLEITLRIGGALVRSEGGLGRRRLFETLAVAEASFASAQKIEEGPGILVFSLRGGHELLSA